MSGNPFLPGWYADPELHAFQNRYYLYPTYSAPYEEQTLFEVWSSGDFTEWQRDGIGLRTNRSATSLSMTGYPNSLTRSSASSKIGLPQISREVGTLSLP